MSGPKALKMRVLMEDIRTSEDFVGRILNAHINGDKGIGGEALSVALEELAEGRKESHWIWYVFPQIKFSGQRPKSAYYSVTSCEDLFVLLEHPVIRANLTRAFVLAADAVKPSESAGLSRVFDIDCQKVASSSTLFSGYLTRYPRTACDVLLKAATDLRDAAERENWTCGTTLDFLKNC